MCSIDIEISQLIRYNNNSKERVENITVWAWQWAMSHLTRAGPKNTWSGSALSSHTEVQLRGRERLERPPATNTLQIQAHWRSAETFSVPSTEYGVFYCSQYYLDGDPRQRSLYFFCRRMLHAMPDVLLSRQEEQLLANSNCSTCNTCIIRNYSVQAT